MLRCELRVLDRVCFGADFFISLKCCGAALSPWYCGCVAGAILERFIAVGCCACVDSVCGAVLLVVRRRFPSSSALHAVTTEFGRAVMPVGLIP